MKEAFFIGVSKIKTKRAYLKAHASFPLYCEIRDD